MDDLISRQAAINEVVAWLKDRMSDGKNGKPLTERLKDLPSAQPEKRTEERTETHACDLISRQKAISVIAKWMLEYGGEGEERERNALKQAAEEIKQIPAAEPTQTQRRLNADSTQNCALDCISRQEAIEALDKIFPADPMRNDYTQGIACGAALATEYIKQLPPVEPDLSEYSDKLWKAAYERGRAEAQAERKTGKWIIDPGIGCKCSVCDFDIGNGLDFMEYVNFCPNCGTRMEGWDGSD